MTAQQPISRIRVKNFRCLEELIISFQDSPIIALSAGNDGGKSSTVKAIQTIMYNNESGDKNYIRTGTKGFEVDIELQDGSCVSRIRTGTSNMYFLYNKNNKEIGRWGTGTTDAKLGTYGIPDIVKDIFNVKLDDATGELLNIRTCESLLLFSLTKTTDNYKMVHSCISSNRIEKAYEVGNKHIKDASTELNKAIALRDDAREQAAKIVLMPDITIDRLIQNKQQLQSLSANLNLINTELQVLYNIQTRQAQLDRLGGRTLEQLEANVFTDIELQVYQELQVALNLQQQIQTLQKKLNVQALENLLKNQITDAELQSLQGLQEAWALLNTINNLLIKCPDVYKIAEAEQAMHEAQRLESITSEIISGLNTKKAIDLLEIKQQAADKIITASADLNELQDQLATLQEALELNDRLLEINLNYNTAQNELQELQESLLGSGGVTYDKESNALIKNCEHCNEQTAFSLDLLQVV